MGRISRPAAFAAFLVLAVADWSHANVRRMPRGPAALYEERPIAARILEPRGPAPSGTYRIFREAMPFRDRGPKSYPGGLARQRVWERNTLVRNLDAMEGFEDLVGYSSSKLVDGLQVLKKGLSPRMLEIYNVRYVLSPYGRAPIDGIRTETVHASPEDDLTVTRLVDARPRAYWARSYRLTRDEAEALAVLRAPEAGDVITIQAEPGLTEARLHPEHADGDRGRL